MSSSSGLRLVLRGPTNRLVSGICRWPEELAIVTDASSAISVGPLSMDGTQVTRLPPSVPRLRVCTAPIECAASTRAGNMSRISGERIISVWVTKAPMRSPASVRAIPLRSSTREMSMTMPGPSAADFRSANRSVPPARTFAAAPCSASKASACRASLAMKSSNDLTGSLQQLARNVAPPTPCPDQWSERWRP